MNDAREIAGWFIEKGLGDNNPLSIMSLLKLAYIGHGWYMALNKGNPLFHNKIEAWPYGPVVVDIYNCFRRKGLTPQAPDPDFPPVTDGEAIGFLEQIYDIYGGMHPWTLSNLTHVSGGPWETAIKWGGKFSEIPNELIMAHYVNKWKAWHDKQQSSSAR